LTANLKPHRVIVLALAALWAFPLPLRSQLPDALDAMLRADVDSGFSGVVLIAVGDSVILERAYASPSTHLDTATAFWVGSITKGFVAAAILTLQESGRLSVRDSIPRFFRDVPTDKRDITLQELLTHTSGIDGHFVAVGIVDRARAIQSILAQRLAYAPGAGYQYMNDDYNLLAAVIEIASGKTYEDYIESRLLRPADLGHTGFWGQTSRVNIAPPSGPPDGVPATVWRDGRPRANWGYRGANGMFSTVGDLYRWLRQRNNAVLSGATREQLRTPQRFVRSEPPRDIYIGYGARIYTLGSKRLEVRHLGDAGWVGHNGVARVLDSGLTVIVLSNSGSHGSGTWSAWVSQQMEPLLR